MLPPIFLCSPSAEQSHVIAKLINKYQPNRLITGVTMPNEAFPKKTKLINTLLPANSLHLTPIDGTLIPTGATSTKFFLEKNDIALGKIILTKNALKVFDKPWLLDKADSIGIPIPTTWQNINSISTYPIFYKQRFEKGGGVRGIAYTQKEIPKTHYSELIFQELIMSKGTYGVCFLAKNGEVLCSHSHFERESIPKSGGSAVIIENFSDKKLLNHTKRLLNSLNYSGWGLAEYKYCPKRCDYVLMEINAKFWASCELAFINEPAFLKLLFNINANRENLSRIIFLDRAIQRGIPFILKHIFFLTPLKQVRLYPGWGKRILLQIIPNSLYRPMKKGLSFLSNKSL